MAGFHWYGDGMIGFMGLGLKASTLMKYFQVHRPLTWALGCFLSQRDGASDPVSKISKQGRLSQHGDH